MLDMPRPRLVPAVDAQAERIGQDTEALYSGVPLRELINRKAYELFWWVEPTGVPIRFKAAGGALYVSDPFFQLRIPHIRRWSRYKRGIHARISRVAADYGVPSHAAVRRGDTVIDVGANVGEFSLYAARAGARVIAIEPDLATLECLRENAAGQSIDIVGLGVWDRDGSLPFGVDTSDANGSFVNAGRSKMMLPVKKLDTIVRELDVARVRLIKADAEGAEPELLDGAVETLRRTEMVTLDCGPERNGQPTVDICERKLREAGFEIVSRQDSGRHNLIARNLALLA